MPLWEQLPCTVVVPNEVTCLCFQHLCCVFPLPRRMTSCVRTSRMVSRLHLIWVGRVGGKEGCRPPSRARGRLRAASGYQ